MDNTATNRSIHLSASAGSGKTRALKERYLALLDRIDLAGLRLDQAVAITFTEKAAAEIKERVMQDLPEAMLKKIIRGRQDLRISTIHSFCMNLLKRYPLEAGLPPDFGVLDERDRAYKVQKAVEDALESSDRDQDIMAPLRGFSADELVDTVSFLLSLRSRIKRMEIDAGGAENLLIMVSSGMDIPAAESEMKALIRDPEWKALFLQMELLLRSQPDYYAECRGTEHGSLAAAPDVHAAYRTAELIRPVYFTQKAEPRKRPPIAKGKYRANTSFPYAVYDTLCSQVQDILSRLFSAYHRALAGSEALSLLRLFFRAEENYRSAKLREGLLDFDDLEIFAYRLLKGADSPEILYWLDRKILHFLVDEFQDTSDIQWAVLRKLTEEIFAGLGADKPMPSTLFVVGDAKQSIYRFREANYRLIESVRTKMEESLLPGAREIRTLDKNYRSVPEVIGAVNQVFSAQWGEAYTRSAANRNRHQGSVQLIEVFPGDQKEAENALSEAGVLAREIRTLMDAGTMVYEKASPPAPSPPGGEGTRVRGKIDDARTTQGNLFAGGSDNNPPLTKGGTGGLDDEWNARPVQYGDCAILIQSRTRLKEYESALKQEGVPFRVVGGIGFYEEDEIQAILNTLFFLWNRDDRLALAAALRSPLFGLPDQGIVDVFSGQADALPVLRERQPQAWSRFNDWSKYAGTEPLAGLIHRIIQDTGAYIRFGKQNPQSIFNLDKLLDTARDFDRRGYTTLQDFVEWVRNIREAEQREATADMNLPGFQGAVSIMTVHKAKGLEFPVVFLPGLNQQPRSLTAGPLAIVESDGRIRLALKDADSPVYDEMWEREKEELKREHQRLLYVAMTRARDHLVMIGAPSNGSKPAKDNTWLSYLYGALAVPSQRAENSGPVVVKRSYPDWEAQTHMPEQYGVGKRSPEQSSPTVAVDSAAVLANLRRLDVVDAPEWKRATDYISDDKEWDLEQPFLPAGKTVSPLLRGNILHRCLEEYAKKGLYDLESILGEYPEMQTLDPDVRERFLTDANTVLRSITKNAGLSWIFEPSPNAHAELPFLLRKGNDMVSGVIDRVIVKDGKGFVIDYKAILIENEDAAASWKNHYLPQVKLYCEAVKEIFRLEQVEGYLLFLDSGRLEQVVKV